MIGINSEMSEEIYEENNEKIINEFPEISTEDLSKSLDDIKIEVTPEDLAKYNKAVPSPPEKKTRKYTKKDVPTQSEVTQMSDEDIEKSIDQKTLDLYMEFNSFLEEKVKITSDSGIKETIPTGIDILDTILGGGFAIGSMAMITGTPGSGKSMLAIQTMGNAQIKYRGNILASMLDSEEATTTIRMSNLGVRNPQIKPYNDITIEKVFKFIEGICLYKEMKKIIDTPSIILWDSIANTLSQKEREVEDINSVIGYKARLLSLLLPKYVAKLSLYNICLITINQIRDLIQMGNFTPAKELKYMSQGKTIPGGNSLKFNAFHLLEMKAKEAVSAGEKYGFDGFFAELHCVKNKLFPPNIKINVAGNFLSGFDNFWTNYKFMVDNKRINTGAWNTLVNYEKRFRTKDAKLLYESDPIFKQKFDECKEECIQTELINKYTNLTNSSPSIEEI